MRLVVGAHPHDVNDLEPVKRSRQGTVAYEERLVTNRPSLPEPMLARLAVKNEVINQYIGYLPLAVELTRGYANKSSTSHWESRDLFIPLRTIIALSIGVAILTAGILLTAVARLNVLQSAILIIGGAALTLSCIGFLGIMVSAARNRRREARSSNRPNLNSNP